MRPVHQRRILLRRPRSVPRRNLARRLSRPSRSRRRRLQIQNNPTRKQFEDYPTFTPNF
jgi:hypothetical protein